ncbi:MAG: DUF262 domain-containing protein [Methylacidiphilales bacterium]|nr:DUF262 domain-containing protein [Candidatus Methylacidiphilales bacterium]NJR15276.1 DUF262 domain-containing protein [Calothrix sp. CSU_2_0]
MHIEQQIDTLQAEIDSKRKQIRSDRYSMSIGEWIALYEQGEIEIYPVFNKGLRWSESQKVKFIESILLGIPISSIFVYQGNSGIWEVVDGLQRLSTIYQFVGILKDEFGKLLPPFTLQKTEYLPSLAGKLWKDINHLEGSDIGFTPEQRLLVRKAKINVNIVSAESNPQFKYDLFLRLNTVDSNLTS